MICYAFAFPSSNVASCRKGSVSPLSPTLRHTLFQRYRVASRSFPVDSIARYFFRRSRTLSSPSFPRPKRSEIDGRTLNRVELPARGNDCCVVNQGCSRNWQFISTDFASNNHPRLTTNPGNATGLSRSHNPVGRKRTSVFGSGFGGRFLTVNFRVWVDLGRTGTGKVFVEEKWLRNDLSEIPNNSYFVLAWLLTGVWLVTGFVLFEIRGLEDSRIRAPFVFVSSFRATKRYSKMVEEIPMGRWARKNSRQRDSCF